MSRKTPLLRAWNKKTQQMVYSRCMAIEAAGINFYSPAMLECPNPQAIVTKDDYSTREQYEAVLDIMISLGKCDKTGVFVYTGDIIKFDLRKVELPDGAWFGPERSFIVVQDPINMAVKLINTENAGDQALWHETLFIDLPFEVVGNLYETPHLIHHSPNGA